MKRSRDFSLLGNTNLDPSTTGLCASECGSLPVAYMQQPGANIMSMTSPEALSGQGSEQLQALGSSQPISRSEIPAEMLYRFHWSNEAMVITEPWPPYKVVHVNSEWERTCEYNQEEAKLGTCSILQGPETCKHTLKILSDAIRREQVITVTLINYRKSGTKFLNTLTISPLYNNLQQLAYFLGRVQASPLPQDCVISPQSNPALAPPLTSELNMSGLCSPVADYGGGCNSGLGPGLGRNSGLVEQMGIYNTMCPQMQQNFTAAPVFAGFLPPHQVPALPSCPRQESQPTVQHSINWCHACKVKRRVVHCTNRDGSICRKRFCDNCLRNHFATRMADVLPKTSWSCPCCQNICQCAACKKKRQRQEASSTRGTTLLKASVPADAEFQLPSSLPSSSPMHNFQTPPNGLETNGVTPSPTSNPAALGMSGAAMSPAMSQAMQPSLQHIPNMLLKDGLGPGPSINQLPGPGYPSQQPEQPQESTCEQQQQQQQGGDQSSQQQLQSEFQYHQQQLQKLQQLMGVYPSN